MFGIIFHIEDPHYELHYCLFIYLYNEVIKVVRCQCQWCQCQALIHLVRPAASGTIAVDTQLLPRHSLLAALSVYIYNTMWEGPWMGLITLTPFNSRKEKRK